MSQSHETFEEACIRFDRDRWAQIAADLLFNDAAMDCIIAVAGKEPLGGGGGRPALSAQLGHAKRRYSFWHDVNAQPAVGKSREWLKGVIGDLASALRRLDHPPDGDHASLDRLIRRADIRQEIEAIPRVLSAFEEELKSESFGANRIGTRSAEHWLIGESLPEIYEKHFGPFGMSRDKETGIPSGPGIRFIVEVLSIMGVVTRDGKPFGPEAVEHYLRHGRGRASQGWGNTPEKD
jgi:hypothetical protein